MEFLHPAMWHLALESWQWIHQVAASCNVISGSEMTCHGIRPIVRHIGILHLVSISTTSPQSTCHSAPVSEILSVAARVWNNLPQHVTSEPSLHVFDSRLKTHFFSVSFPEQFWMYSACEVTSSLLDTLIDHLTYLVTYLPTQALAGPGVE